MLKRSTIGVAIALCLILSLALFTSGASAQSATYGKSGVAATTAMGAHALQDAREAMQSTDMGRVGGCLHNCGRGVHCSGLGCGSGNGCIGSCGNGCDLDCGNGGGCDWNCGGGNGCDLDCGNGGGCNWDCGSGNGNGCGWGCGNNGRSEERRVG